MLKIKEMETQQIMNCIAMLERKASKEILDIPFPCFNGEIAQDAAEDEYFSLMGMDQSDRAERMYPIYTSLRAELEKRLKI